MSHPANRIRALENVRNWNAHFPRGTLVMYEGRECKTDSVAALGARDQPGVWLVGFEELVPLDRLEVPGWVRTNKKKRNSRP